MIPSIRLFPFLPAFMIVVACASSTASAQSVAGIVRNEDGIAIPHAIISVRTPSLVLETDEYGMFRIDRLPAGTVELSAHSLGFDTATVVLPVAAEPALTTIVLHSLPLQLQPVTVTARPHRSAVAGIPQSISVLDSAAVAQAAGFTVADLATQSPGVSATRSGPFSVKPVIRGLGFQRVVLLDDGERHETQQWDDDDSPALDGSRVDRVEIVRGPGSVLYGSDALGGVINFIRTERAANPDSSSVSGNVNAGGFSATRQGDAALQLNGSGGGFGYGIDIAGRTSGNIRTPSASLPNTGATQLTLGSDLDFRRDGTGFLVDYSHLAQHRGILVTNSATPFQRTIHDRLMVRYESNGASLQSTVTGVLQRNDAQEFEDGSGVDPRVHLTLETVSLDGHSTLMPAPELTLTGGADARLQRNRTFGPEPLLPDFRQATLAGYLFTEYQARQFNLSAGIRYDRRAVTTDANALLRLGPATKEFDAVTGSAGLLVHLLDGISLGANLGRGWRAPTVDELFIDGVEEGSLRFKEGDPALLPEEMISTDVVARWEFGAFDGELSAFHARMNRYIFLAPTGTIDSASGYERFQNRQAAASLDGCEWTLRARAGNRLTLTCSGSVIAGRNEERNTWLPLMPADAVALSARISFHESSWLRAPSASIALRGTFDQNKVDPDETPTPGYLLVDASLRGEILFEERRIGVALTVHNLLDRLYHDHLSLYNRYAAEQGIDLAGEITIPFGQ